MERIGDFELLLELATGGMATVHVARHLGDGGFERLVAIKRVHPHLLRDPEVFAMLSDEARLSALVRHPNVVATNQVIDKEGELLLVQDYVEGVSLALLAKRAAARLPGHPEGRLPIDVAVRLVVDLLRGLHAAHEALDLRGEPLRLVHRDVSPQNVLVGGDGVARLIDFGIARAEGRLAETRSGIIKGKLAYMAPEQVAEAEVDRRVDVFAAGVVLHELITGHRPFEGAGDVEVMARMLLGAPDLATVAEVAPALLDPLGKALARDRDDRFATAEAMGEALLGAARPVPDGEMRSVVEALVGDELAARREDIRAAMGRADEPAAEVAPGPAPEPIEEPTTNAARGERHLIVARLPRPWRGVVIVAIAIAAAVGATLQGATPRGGGDPDVVSPDPVVVGVPEGAATSAASSAPRTAPPPAPVPSSPAPTGSSSSARPADRASPPASAQPTPPRSASALPPASSPPSSELHRNPYGH